MPPALCGRETKVAGLTLAWIETLVERFGESTVCEAAKSALGYPLTWIVDASEVELVAAFLQKEVPV